MHDIVSINHSVSLSLEFGISCLSDKYGIAYVSNRVVYLENEVLAKISSLPTGYDMYYITYNELAVQAHHMMTNQEAYTPNDAQSLIM